MAEALYGFKSNLWGFLEFAHRSLLEVLIEGATWEGPNRNPPGTTCDQKRDLVSASSGLVWALGTNLSIGNCVRCVCVYYIITWHILYYMYEVYTCSKFPTP